MSHFALLFGFLVVALLLVGCSGTGEHSGEGAVSSEEADLVHVHGLGIDPADGALLIATHAGLFRAPVGEGKARRVGESYQDTMGFTVIGPNLFLGSGHPDPAALREGMPPLLGLIKSKDGGKTWDSVSLLGKADFHVLRFAEDRLYGYDASNDRLLVSTDKGTRWKRLEAPAPLIDLVVSPSNSLHLVAAGEVGLFLSTDGGQRWGLISPDAGLVAWPSQKGLYLVDVDGRVYVSDDGGETRTPVGEIGGQPAALLAEGVDELYAALHDGTVKASRDGGRTWTVRSSP